MNHNRILELREFLGEKVLKFNNQHFIKDDPISIPHRFTKKQDIEIAGFFAAILAWGQRKTIINKCTLLVDRMDGSPHDFVTNASDSDLKNLLGFKHRTFNDTDLLYCVDFFKRHYQAHTSLETAFLHGANTEEALISFRNYFFDADHAPNRTKKHIASPARNSACKRINMFLRWMVRKDAAGVDFGIWDQFKMSELICPCDVHVERQARKLNLITRPKPDWKMAVELTNNLKKLDPNDPVQYDYALFGMGAIDGEK